MRALSCSTTLCPQHAAKVLAHVGDGSAGTGAAFQHCARGNVGGCGDQVRGEAHTGGGGSGCPGGDGRALGERVGDGGDHAALPWLQYQEPQVRALLRLTQADGAFNISTAAKMLQVQPRQLFAWLSEHGWIYRRAGSKNWLAYQNRLQQGVLVHKACIQRTDGEQERVHEQVLVTAKGLSRLAENIDRRPMTWAQADSATRLRLVAETSPVTISRSRAVDTDMISTIEVAEPPARSRSIGFCNRDCTTAALGVHTRATACGILKLSKIHCLSRQAAKLFDHVIKIRVHVSGAMSNSNGIPLHELRGTYSQHCGGDVNRLRSRALLLSESLRCANGLGWDQAENSSKRCMPGFERQRAARRVPNYRVVNSNGQPTVDELASNVNELPMFGLLDLSLSQLVGRFGEMHGSDANRPGAKSPYDRCCNGQRLVRGNPRNQRSGHEEAKSDPYDHRGGKVDAIENPLHFLASLLKACGWQSLPLGSARRRSVRQKVKSCPRPEPSNPESREHGDDTMIPAFLSLDEATHHLYLAEMEGPIRYRVDFSLWDVWQDGRSRWVSNCEVA